MGKIAVIYWSGTGNTEAMAKAVAEGISEKGAEAVVMTADSFNPDMIELYSGFAFGCPSMGAEQLEESEFQPMWDNCQPKLSGKKAVLFGSYGWGDGEWMRNWNEECVNAGIILLGEGLICNEMPDEDGLTQCRALGNLIAE